MFSRQAPGMMHRLIQAGMPNEQARAMIDTLGQCQASLEHRGPVHFTGPVVFDSMPKLATPTVRPDGTSPVGGENTPSFPAVNMLQLVELTEDLTNGDEVGSAKAILQTWNPDGTLEAAEEIDVWPGPMMVEDQTFTKGSQVLVADFNGYKCPFIERNPTATAGTLSGGFGNVKVGKLNGILSVGATTTFSEWAYNGTTWVDTGRDYAATDWLQSGNEALPIGCKIIALQVFGDTFLIIAAETN